MKPIFSTLTLIVFFIFILSSCGVVDKLESSHYRKFDLTKAVQVDSITDRIYVTDFLPMQNHYSANLRVFNIQVGDTILFRDYQDKIIDFKYE